MKRHLGCAVAALTVALVACEPQTTTTAVPSVAESAAHGPRGAATYEVTVENLTEGQPFTPPLTVTHRPAMRLFEVGEEASEGVKEIAENGNLDPMLEVVEGSRQVRGIVTAGAPDPLMAGASITYEIETEEGARHISFISMLVCTNDGFTGVNAGKLPQKVGESVSWYTDGYDAGTEINTEDFADMVPGCPALTDVPTDDEGTDMSDPALAEGGVIMHHPGIVGDDDLDADLHGWVDPVAMITVTRIN